MKTPEFRGIASFWILYFCYFGQLHAQEADDSAGPMLAAVTSNEASLLYLPGVVNQGLQLVVSDKNGKTVARENGRGKSGDDLVARFHLSGLKPATEYQYSNEDPDGNNLLQGVALSYEMLVFSQRHGFHLQDPAELNPGVDLDQNYTQDLDSMNLSCLSAWTNFENYSRR